MKNSLVSITLPTSDPKRSLNYYTEALLFRNTTVGEFYCAAYNSIELCFVAQRDVNFNPLDISEPNYCFLAFNVSEIAHYFSEITRKGVAQIDSHLDFKPGGFQQFSVVDDNGYIIVFNQWD